jgi:hypothetical protein
MGAESKTNLPGCQSEWNPDDLEWLAQQAEQGVDEDGGDGGTEPTAALSLPDPTGSLESTPPTCNEQVPSDMKLPAVQKDTGEVDRRPTIGGQRPLLNKLLVSQLAGSVPQWLSKPEQADNAIEIYQRFEPQDAAETVLATLAVGLLNASMDGLERAARSGLRPEVRHMELKLTHSGATQITSLIKALDAHRGMGTPKVSVGSVNVSSGANAIVGNVIPPKVDKN